MDQMWIIGSRPPFLVLDEIDAHLDHSNVQVDRGKSSNRRLEGGGLGGACECRNLGRNVVTWELNLQKLMSDETFGEVSPVKMGVIFTWSWGGCPNIVFFFATEDHMCHHGGCYRKIGMKLIVGCLASSGHQRGISQPANLCCLESEVVVLFMPRDQHIHWSGHGICGLSTIRINMLLVEIHPAKKTDTSKNYTYN